MSLLFEEIPFSPKLEVYRANQDQIRNRRPRLHRNTLILGRKAGGEGSPGVPKIIPKIHISLTKNCVRAQQKY